MGSYHFDLMNVLHIQANHFEIILKSSLPADEDAASKVLTSESCKEHNGHRLWLPSFYTKCARSIYNCIVCQFVYRNCDSSKGIIKHMSLDSFWDLI